MVEAAIGAIGDGVWVQNVTGHSNQRGSRCPAGWKGRGGGKMVRDMGALAVGASCSQSNLQVAEEAEKVGTNAGKNAPSVRCVVNSSAGWYHRMAVAAFGRRPTFPHGGEGGER